MKIIPMIARYLLGLMFTVIGVDGFVHLIPRQTPANPLAIHFLFAVNASHVGEFLFALLLLSSLLLLSGICVPLALTLLGAAL